MTNIILIAILCVLAVGLLAIYAKLTEIGDSMSETNGHVERLTDEIVDDGEPL